MKRKTVFCELNFIKTLTDNKEYLTFDSLCKESDVMMDVTQDEFKKVALEDKTLYGLWKKRNDGLCEIKFESPFTQEKALNSLCPVVLSSNTNKSAEIKKEGGFLAFNHGNLFKLPSLEEDSGFAISKGDEDSWKNRLGKPECGNSLIIIDNYILSDTRDMEKNLYEILKILLPETLDVTFNLTIITARLKNGLPLEGRYNKVKQKIQSMKPKLKINFNLFENVSNVFHDRAILSNYFMITCGAGFDLFNQWGKAKHPTMVSITYPFLQKQIKWAVDHYCNQLYCAKKLAKNAVSNNVISQYYGTNKDNRLFQ